MAEDHRELSRVIRAEKPHLILLDLMLPGTDGIKLMEHVPEMAHLPVIFISAYGRDETIAAALGAGAAYFIVKPFSPAELTARIRAAPRGRAEPEPFRLGELAIDYDRRRVTVAGRAVGLTTTECEVLRLLVAQLGTCVNVPLADPPGVGPVSAPRQTEAGARRRETAPTQTGRGRKPARPTSSTSAGSATACPRRTRSTGAQGVSAATLRDLAKP